MDKPTGSTLVFTLRQKKLKAIIVSKKNSTLDHAALLRPIFTRGYSDKAKLYRSKLESRLKFRNNRWRVSNFVY